MTDHSLTITALTPSQAAQVLSVAHQRQVTESQVREVAEAGQLLRADDTFSLIEYVAFLAKEANRGGD